MDLGFLSYIGLVNFTIFIVAPTFLHTFSFRHGDLSGPEVHTG